MPLQGGRLVGKLLACGLCTATEVFEALNMATDGNAHAVSAASLMFRHTAPAMEMSMHVCAAAAGRHMHVPGFLKPPANAAEGQRCGAPTAVPVAWQGRAVPDSRLGGCGGPAASQGGSACGSRQEADYGEEALVLQACSGRNKSGLLPAAGSTLTRRAVRMSCMFQHIPMDTGRCGSLCLVCHPGAHKITVLHAFLCIGQLLRMPPESKLSPSRRSSRQSAGSAERLGDPSIASEGRELGVGKLQVKV